MKRNIINKGFTLVELIIVIVILAILIGITIGGIYMYIGYARKNVDIQNCTSTARMLKEISWTDPIINQNTGKPFANAVICNKVTYDGRVKNFYTVSERYQLVDGESVHSTANKVNEYEHWFKRQITTVGKDVTLFPQNTKKCFIYYWLTDEQGCISKVVWIYADSTKDPQRFANTNDNTWIGYFMIADEDKLSEGLKKLGNWKYNGVQGFGVQ